MAYKTEQEEFWASNKWGNDYINRNDRELVKNVIPFFSKIFSRCHDVSSILEFGANIGLNLHAINTLFNGIDISAIEINQSAVEELKKLNFIKSIYHTSILDFKIDRKRDFVFTRGVLIHINPEYLESVYKKLYESSNRYILIAEYYNPTPVELDYRGYEKKLFKRDFAGDMLELYSNLKLVDYGFVYKRDNNFPQDDISWFLLEKNDNL